MTLMLSSVADGATPMVRPVRAHGGGGERGVQCRGPADPAAAIVEGLGRPVRGLIDFRNAKGEVGGDIGVGFVNAGVENGDAHACAEVEFQGPCAEPAGDACAVAADWTTAQFCGVSV